MNRRYGRYEVLHKLGQGAMAQVFLARDPVLSRSVAIKVLHAELASRREVLQRFFNEARTVAVVRNPHVVEVFDFGQEGNDLYLVMEFVDGLSLHGVLRQLRPIHAHRAGRPGRQADSPRLDHPPQGEPAAEFEPLDSAIAAALMCQAAEGLIQAERHGVVHRDIKPENLMINQQGYLKISDFGIAHVQDDSITKTGAVLGSPLYMSPEQARGLKPITSQADMFSLGAVFYACLAGHPPFQGRNITDLFRKIATQPHIPLTRLRPDLDPALGGLIETLLRKNPADRGGGPRWLHRQLKGYLMALGEMDPADLVSGYMRELASRGIQATWRAEGVEGAAGAENPRPIALPSATLPMRTVATERHTRENDRPRPASVLGAALGVMAVLAVLAVLGIAAAGVAWGVWSSRVDPGSRETGAGLSPVGPSPGDASQRSLRGTLRDTSEGSPGIGRGSLASFAASSVPDAKDIGTKPPPDTGGGRAMQAADTDSGISVPSETGGSQDRSSGPGGPAGASSPAETAALVLKSSPPFAEAFVDGDYMGVTPVRLESLSAGRHRVVLKIKRMPAFDTVLVLKPGLQSFKFRMEADGPGRLAVTPADGP
jgi:protein kinase-like protein/PEGA domain-containing protein